MTLYPDFKEFFESFAAHRVRYLVVGGYALAAHGAPRFTGDIDAWVEPTAENSRRAVEAFDAFGFGRRRLDPEMFAVPNVVVQIGRPPVRIDVLTSLSGVVFGPCHDRRVVERVGDLELDVIGLECLKVNKAASGRPQDLADLDALGGVDGGAETR